MKFPGRLIIAANRLPVTARVVSERVRVSPSDGGLVRAMTSILQDSGGCWIGWPGSGSDESVTNALDSWSSARSYSLQPVILSAAEENGYYRGFSNEIIWPLFHGFSTRCSFNFEYWNHYREVNARFAATIVEKSSPGDFVWVHDYHLMLVAAILNNKEERLRDLAYFHHIPFPHPDIFEILPWRIQILRGLLQFNVIGFQTVRDIRNFIDCVGRYLPEAGIRRSADKFRICCGDQSTTAGVYPISIDYESFATCAVDPAVVSRKESLERSLSAAQLILGVDRLDYTKGILEKLSAYRLLLKRYSEFRERVTLIQIVVPSREEILEYQELRVQIEKLVSNINGEYGKPGWVPVQYFYRNVSRADLVAYYRAASIAAVTPLRDGMNLVAKEFCASRIDAQGVLILSEFAGAVEELRSGAFLVNPHDIEHFAEVLRCALCLDESAQRDRMLAMRSRIEDSNIYRWADSFAIDCLNAGEGFRTYTEEPLRVCS
jgi:trehalose 6-phosphate synthase